jgi:hypothetical protein
MTALRPELSQIVESLIVASAASGEVALDALGDAIGSLAVSYVEVDLMIEQLEVRHRRVTAGTEPRGEADLAVLLPTIRELIAQHGRRPSIAELSERASMPGERVRHALLLARIMQR